MYRLYINLLIIGTENDFKHTPPCSLYLKFSFKAFVPVSRSKGGAFVGVRHLAAGLGNKLLTLHVLVWSRSVMECSYLYLYILSLIWYLKNVHMFVFVNTHLW